MIGGAFFYVALVLGGSAGPEFHIVRAHGATFAECRAEARHAEVSPLPFDESPPVTYDCFQAER